MECVAYFKGLGQTAKSRQANEVTMLFKLRGKNKVPYFPPKLVKILGSEEPILTGTWAGNESHAEG